MERAASAPHNYPDVGAIDAGTPPAGYTLDHTRGHLGAGWDCFTRAVEALYAWRHFELGWVRLYGPERASVGTTVGVLACHYGLWSFNPCRVLQLVNEHAADGGQVAQGFTYGTLAGHSERGEERFVVEWNQADDTVWFDILAMSRPGHPLVALARPLARRVQRRFAHAAVAALQAYVAATR